jgi:hypothetical protein
MLDTDPTHPRLRDLRSTPGTLITTHPDGTTTSRPVRIGHPSGVTPPATVHHDAVGCWCGDRARRYDPRGQAPPSARWQPPSAPSPEVLR